MISSTRTSALREPSPGANVADVRNSKAFSYVFGAVVGLGFTVAAFFFSQWELIRVLELSSFDARLRAEQPSHIDPRIIIVAIDDSSIAKLGRWPWPREFHAALLQAFNEYPPASVGFDILFTEPDEKHPEFDNAMIELCKQLGHVVFAAARDRDARGEYELKPFEALAKAGVVAYINAPRDDDGVLRRLPMRVLDQKSFSHALTALAQPDAAKNLPDTLPIRYRGRMRDFRVVSAAEVLKSLQQHAEGKPESFELKQFLNSIVLVGLAATGTDVAPTPLDSNAPLVVAHANAVSNMLQRDFLTRADTLTEWLAVGIVCMLLGLITAVTRPSVSGRLMLVALCGYIFGSYALLHWANLWIALIGPVIALLPTYGVMSAYRFFIEEKDKRFIKKTLQHYLSASVMEQILANPEMLKLGGDRRLLTVLFSDVRGFTTFCEKNPPEKVVPLLNELLGALSAVVRKHDGTLDKYIGDAIMAFWGAPIPQKEDHALRAVRCAVEMHEVLNRLSQEKKAQGLDALRMGIGINTGEMMVGNMGSDVLFNYTVIGDEVNTGARLEAETRKWEADIIVSESTYELVKDHVLAERLGETKVKGKAKPITIYKVMGLKDASAPAAYTQAVAKA